ncbi:hypothetical protein BJX63DRAFT_394435 [Aspergillus granulosus]|uniref:Uncharacterized protein n=1 Tax=Aspergillus granulosus TaxID=176169 RepID=A0ABR4HDG0_9EURO
MGREQYRIPFLFLLTSCLGNAAALAVSTPTMETTGQSHPTNLVHGHGHHHLPDLDGTKTADEVIILILGAIVFLTFALGLIFQLCETPPWLPRRKHHVWNEEADDENDHGQFHQMADLNLDLESASSTTSTVTDRLLEGRCCGHHPLRWATRYGTITQHHVDVGGVRKMVLVIEAGLDDEGAPVHDGYSQWFERFRVWSNENSVVGVGERVADQRDLLEDDVPFNGGDLEQGAPWLEFDPNESGTDEYSSALERLSSPRTPPRLHNSGLGV